MNNVLFDGLMVFLLLVTVLLTWTAFVLGSAFAKMVCSLFMLFLLTIFAGIWNGLTTALFTFVGMSLIPLAVPFIFYPVARLKFRETEAVYGESGIEVRFDILAGYKSIWS